MKKKFKCEVDCAHCAAKLEDAIKKIDGVEDTTVNFLPQKLMVQAPDDQFDAVMETILKTAKKIEPDTIIHLK